MVVLLLTSVTLLLHHLTLMIKRVNLYNKFYADQISKDER